jgi:hypothetical protein
MDVETFVREVSSFREELFEEVMAFYQSGDKDRGRLAFSRWQERLIDFLRETAPKEAERF